MAKKKELSQIELIELKSKELEDSRKKVVELEKELQGLLKDHKEPKITLVEQRKANKEVDRRLAKEKADKQAKILSFLNK